MAEVTSGIFFEIIKAYNSLMSILPFGTRSFINLFLLVILIVAYSIIMWKFHKFISAKNIFGLNLNKYNNSNHPLWEKTLAGALYLVEYIVIIPFLIFFWFAVFTFFLSLLTSGIEVGTILLISALIVAAIRMTSYYKEDLSKELAKLLPLNLLAIAMLTPRFFDVERIISNFSGISGFFNEITFYIFFIIILEIVLRFFDFIFSLFGLEEEGEEKEE